MTETRAHYDARPRFRVDLHFNPRGTHRPGVTLHSVDTQVATPLEAGMKALQSMRRTAYEGRKAGGIGVYRMVVRDGETFASLIEVQEAFSL